MHVQQRPGATPPPRQGARWRAVAGSVAVVVLVLSAGCGGEDDAGPATTTAPVDAEQWALRLDERCASLNERYGDLAEADPSDRAEAVAYAERVEDFAEDLVEVLEASGTPAERAVDAEQFVSTARELETAARQLAAAAEQGDAAPAEAAAGRLDELGEQLNPLADELGITSCGGF